MGNSFGKTQYVDNILNCGLVTPIYCSIFISLNRLYAICSMCFDCIKNDILRVPLAVPAAIRVLVLFLLQGASVPFVE